MAPTKDDLVKALADETGYPRNQSTDLIEALLEPIHSAPPSGEDVLISGYGKFCVKTKRERRGRNPATGEELMLEARKVVTFKCSRQLWDKINNRQHD
jgi:integration host factor subunit alpha